MNKIIKASEIFLENQVIKDGRILLEDGIIKEINPTNTTYETIELQNLKLIPGLIDIHVHGGNGFDVMDGTYNAINELSKYKLKEGVTSFCPTTVTSSIKKTELAIDAVKEAIKKGVDGAKIIGIFLEGPYISPKYKGAHPEEFIRNIDLKEIKELISYGEGYIKSIAIAPDLDNAMEIIEYLTSVNVDARIGHSGATLETAEKAISNGAKIGIHTYNAMSPLTHREPGMVGAILTNDNIYAEIICDLVHTHEKAIEVVVRCKGYEKVILITDCMMAGGLKDGRYTLGELAVDVQNKIARTLTGALAGSTLKLIDALKNMTQSLSIPLLQAIHMASINPAKALGLDKTIGSIATNKTADFIAIDDDFNIQFTMINGNIIK